MRQGYDFDDLLLVPKNSSVNSRTEVNIGVDLGNTLHLDIPIIASPMKGIVGVNLITKLSELGGIGILHRFQDSKEEWKQSVDRLVLSESKFGVSIGLGNYDFLDYALTSSANVGIICVDVANGYLKSVLDFCKEIEQDIHLSNTLLMAGNVATADGFKALEDVGVDLIRVGIGPGALCTTRNVTGVGVPQLTAINWCSYAGFKSLLVADGGIRNSGDMVKALAMGADVVMIGSLFAKSFESDHDGIIYGMASRRLQEEYYHGTKSIEGIEAISRKVCPLSDIVDEFVWGLKSACTYMGASNIHELFGNANFIAVGNGSIKKL